MSDSPDTRGARCCRLLRLEFCHYSRLCLTHHDKRAFAYTPWLPYRWYFQMFFIIYRWVIAGYFASWLIAAGLSYINDGDAKFFIFLTNWGFLTFNAHLIWSAVVSTIDFFKEFVCCRQQYIDAGETRSAAYKHDLETPTGCCGRSYNKIKWYHMIQWGLFATGTEVAVAITIIYWPLIYNPNLPVDGIRFNTHGTQGITAVIELLAVGVPVRFYHFYFTGIFAVVYNIIVFTGIYYAAGGTNLGGDPFIYSIIDYGNHPGGAVGVIFAVVFVLLPFVHVLFYLAYAARYWIVYLIYSKRTSSPDRTRLEEGKQSSPEIGTEL